MAVAISTIEQGIVLIQVTGSFLGGEETDELRLAISDCLDRQQNKLILDVSGVTFVNSAAVGVLVSALISYKRRGWQMKLCGINKVVHTILTVTKLNLVFDRYDTCAEAIRSIT